MWLIWTIVILLIIGGVIKSIMTTYNWYRGVSAGVSAVGNLSSAGAYWIRAKANKTRANTARGNSSNSAKANKNRANAMRGNSSNSV